MIKLQTVGAKTEIETINKILYQDGCVVIKDVLDEKTLRKLQAEVEPHFQQTPDCQGDFYGYYTKRLSSLISKSPVCGEMAINAGLLQVMDEFFLQGCEQYQLNLTQGIRIGPGEYQQPLHRDDAMFPFPKDNYQAMVNCMWAVDDFTAENGATLLVPGSHKWPTERKAQDHEIVQGIMPAGSVLIWLGSLLHAGGPNNSGASRTGIVISYCLGWLRQSENQYLAVPLEQAKKFPERLQRLIGYFVHAPNLGQLEGQDPIKLLSSTKITNQGFEEFMPEVVRPLLAEHRKKVASAA